MVFLQLEIAFTHRSHSDPVTSMLNLIFRKKKEKEKEIPVILKASILLCGVGA